MVRGNGWDECAVLLRLVTQAEQRNGRSCRAGKCIRWSKQESPPFLRRGVSVPRLTTYSHRDGDSGDGDGVHDGEGGNGGVHPDTYY